MICFFPLSLVFTGKLRAQNLLVNAGFETATVGLPGGTPIPAYPATLNSWSAVTVDGEYIYDLTRAHSGTGFLSVLQNAGANPVTPWLGMFSPGGYDRAGQRVAILPSTQYQLSFWYKYGDGSRYTYGAGSTVLQVEQLLPTNATIHSQVIPTTASWQYFSVNFTTGPAATDIIVLFSGVGPGNVDIWIDDAELIQGCALNVNLGNDTTVCSGNPVVLNGTTTGATSYLWSNNATTPTITVNNPGTYWVEVSDGNCTDRDTDRKSVV